MMRLIRQLNWFQWILLGMFTLIFTEGARIVVLNGSQVDGLASRAQENLLTQGANVVETANGEFAYQTRIVDYTGNPHTVQYLTALFEVLPGFYEIQYDPNSQVDIVITLGVD
jgi:hypothetical protein